MWENSRIIRNTRFHPFLWPWYVIAAIVGLYLLSTGVLYYLYQREQASPDQELYEKALDTRREELLNFKLTGIEPYVWKPLFECRTLNQKNSGVHKKIPKPELNAVTVKSSGNHPVMPAPASGEKCIKSGFSFVESGKSIPLRKYAYGTQNEARYAEMVPEPCLICHKDKSASLVQWSFLYSVEKPEKPFTALWKSPDFARIHMLLAFIMILYLGIRLFYKVTRANDLIAVAVRSGKENVVNQILEQKFARDRRMFFYIEVSSNFVCGYIPRRHMIRLYKKYFTGLFDYTELDLRIGIVEYNAVSFEGLRIAQAIASKALSSSVIVQDKLLSLGEGQSSRKAVWKRKNSQLEFNVIEMKKKMTV